MSSNAVVTNSFITLITTGGIVAAINDNATLVSAGIGVTGIAVGVVFHVMTVLHNKEVLKRTDQEYKDKIKEEILKEIEKESVEFIDQQKRKAG